MAYRPEIAKIVLDRERAEKVVALKKFIEAAAADYRKEGVPIDADGRIDMQAFGGLYPDVQKDLANVREWREEFVKKNPEQVEDPSLRDGERLEMLIHAILYKNMRSKFIVTRSSPFDDIHHDVDNALFDKETGDPICAFDEVGDTNGQRYEKKQTAIRGRNLDERMPGAVLKYGLKVENKNGKVKVVPGAIDHVPIFYIALSHDLLEKGMKEFVPSAAEQSEFEKKLFEYFLKAVALQIDGLELYSGRLDPNLKNRLAAFKKTLADLRTAKK